MENTTLSNEAPWLPKTVSLDYKFFGRKLFSARLRSLLFDCHFTRMATGNGALRVPPGPLDGNVDCALVHSHPISSAHRPIVYAPEYIRYVLPPTPRYFIKIQGSFPDYLQKFTHKSRYNVLRCVRLYNDFSGSSNPWKEYRRQEEMDAFHHWAREVSRTTYQERLLGTGMPRDGAFLKELAAKDSVRGYILFHGERPVAYLCCPIIHDSIAVYYYVGFDPAYQKWSPGLVLFYYALKRLFEENRFQIFDFTTGGGADPQAHSHKRFFSTDQVLCSDVYYFKRSFRNGMIVYSHYSLFLITKFLRKCLEALRLKDALRKWVKISAAAKYPAEKKQAPAGGEHD